MDHKAPTSNSLLFSIYYFSFQAWITKPHASKRTQIKSRASKSSQTQQSKENSNQKQRRPRKVPDKDEAEQGVSAGQIETQEKRFNFSGNPIKGTPKVQGKVPNFLVGRGVRWKKKKKRRSRNVTELFKKPFCLCLVEDVNLGIAFLRFSFRFSLF